MVCLQHHTVARLQHPQGVWSPPVVETAIQLVINDDDKVDIVGLSEMKEVGLHRASHVHVHWEESLDLCLLLCVTTCTVAFCILMIILYKRSLVL